MTGKGEKNRFGFSLKSLRRTARRNQAIVNSQNIASGAIEDPRKISAEIAITEMQKALDFLTKEEVLKNWRNGSRYYRALAEVYPG